MASRPDGLGFDSWGTLCGALVHQSGFHEAGRPTTNTKERRRKMKKIVEKTVRMEVLATVTFPPGAPDTSDDMAIQMAMSAVTQSHEVDCGLQDKVLWAKVYAEISDDDCVVNEVEIGNEDGRWDDYPQRQWA
jgi:hypothetical protein